MKSVAAVVGRSAGDGGAVSRNVRQLGKMDLMVVTVRAAVGRSRSPA